MRYQRAELPLTIDGLAAAREFFAGCIADSNPLREHLFVAHLDGQSRCVHLSRHSGDETGADFPLRTIVADAADEVDALLAGLVLGGAPGLLAAVVGSALLGVGMGAAYPLLSSEPFDSQAPASTVGTLIAFAETAAAAWAALPSSSPSAGAMLSSAHTA